MIRSLVVLLVCILPLPAVGQGVATLIADQVVIEDGNRLVATGNVEAFYDGTRLSAAQITFDRTTDQLIIDGPIFIGGSDGTVLTATQATLDPQLENGLLRGARIVLDQRLQRAANQARQIDGRYAQLQQAIVSSCNVCGNRPALWDIRAERVLHDQEAQQLYFENATFHVRGVPLLWLPYARLPDPTLDRATGFLIPRIRTSDTLGTGIKIPYFIRLGDHRDLTLTPYLSAETRTIEATYRQAFFRGDLRIEGAVSQDTLQSGRRSYAFADGVFDIGGGTTLSFDIKTASDKAYLVQYGFADVDRLESGVTLENITTNRLLRGRLSYFETLRDDETNQTLPPVVADTRFEEQMVIADGWLRYGLSADAVIRTDPLSGNTGRDVTRLGGFAGWSRVFALPGGLRSEVSGEVRADAYQINNDGNFDTTAARFAPTLGATFRWPLIRKTSTSVQTITPTLSLAWSESYGDTPPNEDSTRAELDQANLFALSRFPGDDRIEVGVRAALGFTYSRTGIDGSFAALTFGRVVRSSEIADFSPSSGLDGKASDWLLAGQITSPVGIYFDGRILVDDDLQTNRGAGRLGWRTDQVDLTAAYIWQAADPTENRPGAVSEWTFDTSIKLSEAFAITADARYDVAADSPASAGFGFEWRNECVTINASVQRRFTSSDDVEPSTDYDLTASLTGFSAGRSAGGPVAGCTNGQGER